jgi:hypothetical protein
MRNNINSTIERYSQAARREQLHSPDSIQKTKAPSGGGGETAPAVIYATVIESPLYTNPANIELPGGRAYYTLRLLTNAGAYAAWADDVQYHDDDLALDTPDGALGASLYKSILEDEGTPPNQYQINHRPSTSPTYWEKQEEIRVEEAIGRLLTDLRLFIPRYEVGRVVPIISIGDPETWFINKTFTYRGLDAAASIMWIEGTGADGRAGAVYK